MSDPQPLALTAFWLGVLSAALGAAVLPIAAVVTGIGLLSGAIVANWRGITNLATSIGVAFQDIYLSAKKWLIDALEPVIRRVKAMVLHGALEAQSARSSVI